MTTTAINLVKKWIERNRELGLSDDQIDGTTFVFGDSVCTIKKNENKGEFDINSMTGKVVIFRGIQDLEDEYTCRICGTEYDNKIDTIKCCMNGDE